MEYLTPNQAAEAYPNLGNAEWFRRQMIGGKLWGTKVGGRWFTTLDDIEDMVERGQNFKRKRRNRVIQP
ncbi:hypothetical protein [Nocardioides sp. AN3]